jgi:hypothetical protein
MIELRGDWNISEWYDWLESQGLQIGRDFRWAWRNDNWAIEFLDDRQEIIFLLKSYGTELWSSPL